MNKRLLRIVTAAVVLSLGTAAQASGQLQISISEKDVDLDQRILHFRLNRPAAVAEVRVVNLDGAVLAQRMEHFDSPKPGTRLSISWPDIGPDQENFKVELRVTDTHDFWVTFEIVRFYGDIPHEEVIFESGKWDILPAEAHKLDAVIPLIVEMVQKFQRFSSSMQYSLYIAGHTDTVGSAADNRTLSENRARAIARYLVQNGLGKLKIAIYVRGFGEEALAVQTGDNVDEPRNRRADYIVSNFSPAMKGPGTWRRFNK